LNDEVRWEGLASDQQPLLPGAVVRTFDTPGFSGMTFYEVRAKSLINRMRGNSRVPFDYTINPYRGCSHACTYCLLGSTPVLLPDGSSQPLEGLKIGQAIIGTVRDGRSRRYTVTTVRAKWPTVKPGYRLLLRDGRSVVASGEHRFLTDDGWKHVTMSVAGPDRRPFLRPGDQVLGVAGPGALSVLQESRPVPVEVVSVEPAGLELPMWDVTTATGDFVAAGLITHNCFARHTHTYLDLDAGHDFDSKIVVKVNAVELLRKELASPRWEGDAIAMGTNMDCYQRAEGRYQLMPGIISALGEARNPFSILTKGTLMLRDLPLLQAASSRGKVSVAYSVGFLDETLWRLVESGTPSPLRRLEAVREFTYAGFRVGVLMAPILPGLTDAPSSLESTVTAIAASGAASITPLVLHLRPGAREWYLGWLARERADLVPLYQRLYRGESYASADYQRLITARVRRAQRRVGMSVGEQTLRTGGTSS
jgi:DNA repair photolyase